MRSRSSTLLVLGMFVWVLCLTGCGQSRSVDGLAPSVPDAEPCGDGCPAGTSCVPGIDEDGNPSFLCIDVHNRYCAPCLEDADCIDPLQPDARSVCLTQDDGSGSFCATDCTTHTDCPEGAYCSI
ncbi:MAG: hypothetical protein VX834_06710, partial [Myxococcota bacterium]|nr:hypothetical protein [Myxococcota bacterium]